LSQKWQKTSKNKNPKPKAQMTNKWYSVPKQTLDSKLELPNRRKLRDIEKTNKNPKSQG
jgi:hypothetical protein